MIIKSDFKDYYDGLQRYDEDRETLFLRKREEIDSPFSEREISDLKIAHFIFDNVSWIGFAGEIYPFYDSPAKHDSYGKIIEPRQLFFGCELITEKHNSTRYAFDRFRYSFSQRNPVYNHLEAPGLIELCFNKFGPIFYIYSNSDYGTPYKAIKNPRLSNLNFAKVLPPHLAYNALQRYVYNQTNPERPIPDMPNDIKIHQAGFDLKKSFRKPKSN